MVLQNKPGNFLNTFSWRGVGRGASLSLIKQLVRNINVVGEVAVPPSDQAL